VDPVHQPVVFSRGLLTGSRPAGAHDLRAHLPRFTGDNAPMMAHLDSER